ncbi:DUF6844 domain-containing protein [Campylobacter upsaliensis]|uniref:DUF6844 domain-containing protein n=1 Tax=Campylobacter upsaliensis TaxID=28080 RepID=UPI002B3AF5F1|nr:hypothetical protein [Campylobacter upsaliensis]MEB2822197.1 hypothetical protein [Campylobacter upsaliensis]
MKKILINSLILVGFLYAKPIEISQNDINLQNELSDASQKDISPQSLDDFFDEFAQKYDIEYSQTKDGKTFYTGEAEVLLKENDPEFAKALSVAYQRAILNLQRNFIKDTFGRSATERISKYYADNSTNTKEFEELSKGGTMEQIFDKLTQLVGAKLDTALQDLGINAEGLSEERKKTLLKDEFLSKTIVNAVGQMSGLVPVQSVITHKNGAYRIGVVAVISNKTRQIARDMALGRESLIKGKGKNIMEYLPKENAGFVNEYGIRLVYDENGSPVILSYGHWGFVPNANDARITNRLESASKESALNQADAAIIEFINLNVSLKDEQTTGDSFEQSIKQSVSINDGSTEEIESTMANVIDKINQQVKTKSSGKIRGIRTLKRWSFTAENGVEHTGVVRAYSFANLKNTNEMLQQKPNSQNTNSKSSGEKVQRSSNIVNSIDDF